jgi:hypothetical protein
MEMFCDLGMAAEYRCVRGVWIKNRSEKPGDFKIPPKGGTPKPVLRKEKARLDDGVIQARPCALVKLKERV